MRHQRQTPPANPTLSHSQRHHLQYRQSQQPLISPNPFPDSLRPPIPAQKPHHQRPKLQQSHPVNQKEPRQVTHQPPQDIPHRTRIPLNPTRPKSRPQVRQQLLYLLKNCLKRVKSHRSLQRQQSQTTLSHPWPS